VSKWEMVKLGSINCYQSKSVDPMKKPDCMFELYSVPSFDNDYPEIVTGAEIGSTKQAVQKDDVLLCKINPRINRVWYVKRHTEHPLIASSEWIVIRNNNISSKYLVWCLRSKPFRNLLTANVTGIGGSLIRVQPKQVKEYPIPLPPLETQMQIAKTLDTTAELLALRKKQLAELDNLIKSTFYDMFGDPVTNEKGWKIRKLSEIGNINRGISKHRPRNDPALLGGAHPLIQTGDVANADFIIREYKQTYSDLGLKQSKKWLAGTLCITIAANIAKTAIMGFDACFPDSVVGFTANEQTNNIFIFSWFGFFQKIIEAQAPESAQKNINLRILNDLDVIVPPIKLQSQFAQIVTKIEEQKVLVKNAISETQYLFDSLMSQYFD